MKNGGALSENLDNDCLCFSIIPSASFNDAENRAMGF